VKKATIAQDIARVLYESLTNAVLEQLQIAAEKLEGVRASDKNVQKRIDAALPDQTLPQIRNFVLALANEGELDQLPLIAQAFERLRLMQSGATIVDAEVVSAVSLEATQRERIATMLEKQHHVPGDSVRFRVDETLIGGLVIRVGDKVFDNSLRSRLGTVQQNMRMS
jgi:F-type H+-transporting ATPase subunit delta